MSSFTFWLPKRNRDSAGEETLPADCCCAFLVYFLLTFSLSEASSRAEDKINFNDQVAPVIEANCSKCHNADKKKADLDLTSYQGILKGSGSGQIVSSGNLDGSKLWKALTHAEEPYMPPNRPKLPDKDLDVFKQWILGGLLESAGGKAIAAVKPGMDLALKPEELAKPDGPPPLPEGLPLDCVVHTSRMRSIMGLASSPWAPLVAIAGQKQVLLFHTETFQLVGILPFNEGDPVDLKFSHNGKLLVASGGRGAKSGRVVVWDVVTGEHLMTLGQEYDTVLAADIRPDQSMVALGGPNRLVKVYSTKSGELLHKIKKHTDWVTGVAFSPNGQMLATADRNGGISLWDPDSAQELFTLAGHKSAVTALSWRADSKLLASSSEDGTVKLWEAQEGKQVKSWTAHNSGALWVSYSRDGRLATCGRDKVVILWDSNGTKKNRFEGFEDIPLRVVFNQDGSRVITSDFLGRCSEWNTADAKKVGELEPNPLPLDQQLAMAQTRLTELQAAAERSLMDGSQEAGLQTNATEKTLTTLRAEVARLEEGRIRSLAYSLRERLATEKQEQGRLAETIEADRQAIQKTDQDVAAAKKVIAKANAQLDAAKTAIARDTTTAHELAGKIEADQAELQHLLGTLHSSQPDSTNAASAKLAVGR